MYIKTAERLSGFSVIAECDAEGLAVLKVMPRTWRKDNPDPNKTPVVVLKLSREDLVGILEMLEGEDE